MNFVNPLVTVRIPSYNHEKYIEKAILSIINQTFQDFELIVIDDCSIDRSDEIIVRLQKEHGFKYIRHSVNKGLIHSMNEFLDLAKGKYIAGCASDDYWEKDKLEYQAAFMEAHPEYIVSYGKAKTIDKDGRLLGEMTSKYYRSGYIFDELLLKKFSIIAPTTMIKLKHLREVGGYEKGMIMEDFPMWVKLAEKYPFGFIDRHLIYYRIHELNLTRKYEERLKAQKIVIDKYKHKPAYKKALSYWHFRAFLGYGNHKSPEIYKHLMPSLKFFYKKHFWYGVYSYCKPWK